MYMLGLASPIAFKGNLVPILVTLIGTCWGFFIHANVRWRFGPLEWLISTPAFHHWHHTNDGPAVINKNYSPTLPWVDWLFGTFYLPGNKHPERYGIDHPLSPVLFGQLVEPFLIWREPGGSPSAGVPRAEQSEDTRSIAIPRMPDSESELVSNTDA
jgi:sterol desaturase/sphingolipid hydroxylase (fatty acid hydroxylase superfamily)